MKSKLIKILIAIILLTTTSCIHTESLEQKHVAEPTPTTTVLTEKNYGALATKSAIYLPEKLPLEDFFTRVRKGEFSEAFQKMDLNYRPSSINDKALENIIEAGFVPVYIKVKNVGTKPISLSEKNFSLTNKNKTFIAYSAEALPREFKNLNPSAVAANVYNTTVVFVGFTAILVALLIHAKTPGHWPQQEYSLIKSSDYLNETTKTIRVNYRTYLITETSLKPGEETMGLVFFNLQGVQDLETYQLDFSN